MGYGCGFGFGLVVAYVFWFKTEKPQWLLRFFDRGSGKTGWPIIRDLGGERVNAFEGDIIR